MLFRDLVLRAVFMPFACGFLLRQARSPRLNRYGSDALVGSFLDGAVSLWAGFGSTNSARRNLKLNCKQCPA